MLASKSERENDSSLLVSTAPNLSMQIAQTYGSFRRLTTFNCLDNFISQAVEWVQESRGVPEDVQRRLYGLFQVATLGTAPPRWDAAKKITTTRGPRYQAREQWEAHRGKHCPP